MAELVACPSCQRKLQVPEQYLGQQVQCPECQHMFTATTATVSEKPLPAPTPATSKPKRFDDDEEEAPRRRHDEFDDDDDDDLDVRNRHRRRNRYLPHRGGLILALGLVALIGGFSIGVPALIGPVAWMLASWDLAEIRAGRMDPDGAQMIQTGQVCAIVATAWLILGGCCIGFAIMAG